MTKVAILPEPAANGGVSYRAVAGDKQSVGRTAGEALDALTTLLPPDATGTLIVVQSLRPDRFFTAEQQQRLSELMEKWQTARDQGTSLSADEQSELEGLTDAKLQASRDRAAALLSDVAQ